MNSLYNLALRQSSAIHSDLSKLESEARSSYARSNGVPTAPSPALSGQIAASFAALSRTVDEYAELARREVVPAKQSKALARVEKFRSDERELRAAFERAKSGQPPPDGGGVSAVTVGPGVNGRPPAPAQSSSYARSPTASSATAESPFSLHARTGTTYGTPNGTPPGSSTPDPLAAYRMNASAAAMFGSSTREGHALREHSFIQNTEIQLDNFIAQGREVWGNLTEQRDILKGTQRRLRDAANTMGLSRDVISYIERRSTQDNILLVVGAIFTLVCFFFIYKYLG